MTNELEWAMLGLNDKKGCNAPGIYRIRLFKKGKPVEICRFGGVDETGLLLVGRSVDIERRREQFIRSSKGKHGHSEGIQWWLVTRFSDIGKQSSLRFEFVRLSEEKAREREKAELQDYFKRYLETPPLNATIPQRLRWFDELRKSEK